MFVVPTRELAIQVTEWLKLLSTSSSSPSASPSSSLVQCIISGVDKDLQISLLKKTTPSIIVGTPKRLFEIYNEDETSLDFSRLQILVVDEIDRIVDAQSRYENHRGKGDKKVHLLAGQALIQKIINQRKKITHEMKQLYIDSKNIDNSLLISEGIDSAKERTLQVVCCSATVNNPVKRLLKSNGWISNNALVLDVNEGHKSPDMIKHSCYVIDKNGEWDRLEPEVILAKSEIKKEHEPIFDEALADDDNLIVEKVVNLINELKIKNCFVFANASTSITTLTSKLISHGIKASKLFNMFDYKQTISTYSSLSPADSNNSFSAVKAGEVDVVVCTEYESRGLDLPQMTTVFVLGLASSPGSYLHMAGRSSRFGKCGRVITILGSQRYVKRFRSTMRLLRINVE